jgi:hypothetical protein
MEHEADKPYREAIRSNLIFCLVMGAAVFPLVQLDDHSDPLLATSWYTSTELHSGGLAFFLSLSYAAATYLWLRVRSNKPAYVWYALGAATGLVPGLLYAVSLPERVLQPPIVLVLGAGIVWGVILSGPAYLMLRNSRTRTHVA